jgi:hypothetical protein
MSAGLPSALRRAARRRIHLKDPDCFLRVTGEAF